MEKKYSKKRLNYKVSSRSGSGLRDMENDEAELTKYTFMGWLDDFIRPKKTNESLVLLTSREEESDIEDSRKLLKIQLLKLPPKKQRNLQV